jgi:hypothetical protein
MFPVQCEGSTINPPTLLLVLTMPYALLVHMPDILY